MSERRRTILVVDDVPDDILILEEILKKDYQVKAVTNGEAALKIARGNNPPDLMLLDIIMPGMDGFEVCRRLRQDSDGTTIPIIFLTAKVMNSDEKLGFELGAVDYIRKPVDPEIVKTRIRAHLDQKDQAMRASEVRFRRLFETSKDGIMIVDNGTGLVVDVNPSMAVMLGLSQEYFLGKRASEVELLKNILTSDLGLPESRQHEYVRYKDQPMETFDGRKIYVEFFYNSYEVNHREVTQVNIRDITSFVAAERERDMLASRLSHYLATSPTVTYSLRIAGGKAPLQWVSENVRGLLGYSPEEAMEDDWWQNNVHSADKTRAAEGIQKIIGGGDFAHEYRFFKKDREIVWLRDEMRFVQPEHGEAEIVGTLTDITDRRKVEADLELNSIAMDAAANAIVICHRDGLIRWINPAYEKIAGFSRAEAIGQNISVLLESSGLGSMFDGIFWESVLSGQVWHGEAEKRIPGGRSQFVEVTVTPVRDETRNVSGFIGILSDDTERRQALDRLEASLKEKGVLLREIHHRVNNNMQLITSLLSLSSQNIGEDRSRKLIEEISRRIQTLALVHQQFYDSEDMARINFVLYLHQAVAGFGGEAIAFSGKVSVVSREEAVMLNLEQAIPAGLIAAELIANARQHAYPEGSRPGGIRVELRRLGSDLELSVLDEGVGLPTGLDLQSAETLGMILIHTLAGQLDGEIEFRCDGGTEAILRFKIA
jgi:PAS domain S-box-containing protein